MLEILENRINHALRSAKSFQENPVMRIHLIESVVYQLELALADLHGFRIAHPEAEKLEHIRKWTGEP